MTIRLPEYFTASNVISALALIVAVVSSVLTYRVTQIEGVRLKREQLRSVIGVLLDVRKDLRIALETGERPHYDLYFERRQIQFEAAEDIIRQIPSNVTWAEYNTLAKEAIFDESFERGFEYLQLSQASASGVRAKVYSLSGLGGAYFMESPMRNYEKGREAFREAIAVLEATRESYFNHVISGTYETWAEAEFEAGFRREALDLLSRAEKYARELSPDDPTRPLRLRRIAKAVVQINSGSNVSSGGSARPNPAVQGTLRDKAGQRP